MSCSVSCWRQRALLGHVYVTIAMIVYLLDRVWEIGCACSSD